MIRIFISSVQKEFEAERTALGEFIAGDALLRRQFETFIFERDIPAADRRPDAVYLEELRQCGLYLGLFGNEYGWENEDGHSPTQLEFDEATRLRIPRLIYVKGADDRGKASKMRRLIRQAGDQLIRRRFTSFDDLRSNVFASLVHHLEATGIIHKTPWDATRAPGASLDDIDAEAVRHFVRQARTGRNFPLAEDAAPSEVLAKLNLLDGATPTRGAILLFGREPQRHLAASVVKCAHFHGTRVAKPIPAHLDVKGTAFQLVDGAVDFILSKINVGVGTREESSQAPVSYEIPREVIREAIVNAVAHRDYTSNGSVQVSLFSDRLEIRNPGNLPPSLTLDMLRKEHGSFPRNLLFAEALYLVRYIERYGTGIGDMIAKCREAGLPEPDFELADGFVTIIRRPVGAREAQASTKSALGRHQVAPSRHQVEILRKCLVPSGMPDLIALSGRTDRTKYRNQVLNPLLAAKLVEMTIPDKPTSSRQQYRTTQAGRQFLEQLDGERYPS
jgi:ATP-dependent DNA helicase RecG